jgi:uncharacterized protein YutE (UPF0331/DUF86 family)
MTRDIQGKLDLLRDNLEHMARIPQGTLEEFLADFRNLDAALHRLQTTIQALVDVGIHKLTGLGLGTPRSSQDIFERLESAGHLPAGTTARYRPVLAFRNRVVHLYDRVDPARVYQILRHERGDLAQLLQLLLVIPDLP